MKKYSEIDVTWSAIEKYYPYNKVVWHMRSNGIPVYAFYDENDEKIDISTEVFLND